LILFSADVTVGCSIIRDGGPHAKTRVNVVMRRNCRLQDIQLSNFEVRTSKFKVCVRGAVRRDPSAVPAGVCSAATPNT
jgi:hypothetical protein